MPPRSHYSALIIGIWIQVVKVSKRVKDKIIRGYLQIKSKMLENEVILRQISGIQNVKYSLNIDANSYPISSISIEKTKIPVRKPTTRGGVYFTDTMAYRIKAVIFDLSISSHVPKLMLGPNTDFKPVLIQSSLKINGADKLVALTAHLVNVVNSKDKVELNFIVDKVDLR
jgi:hypothetical protein